MLSQFEDMRLRNSIMLSKNLSLYEYFCRLPLDELEKLPQRGPSDQLGSFELTPQAMALRDYILRLRYVEIDFQKKYSEEVLNRLSTKELRAIIWYCFDQMPIWPYSQTVRMCLKIVTARPDCTSPDPEVEQRVLEYCEEWKKAYERGGL